MNARHSTPVHMSRRSVLRGVSASLLAPVEHVLAATDTAVTAIEWPTLHLLDGSTLKPASWAGTPAVLVFWATWCPYCKRHNANIERLYQMSLGKSLRVLGVSTEADHSRIGSYMQANQFHFPVALVDSSFRAQFSDRPVIPLTCLISARGLLMQAIPGEMSQDDILSLASVPWA